MKVGMIVPGGVDRSGTHRVIPVLLWLIERLAREVELHVFTLRQEARPGSFDLLGARVHNIGARPRRLRAVAALVAERRRGSLDLLHAIWGESGVVAAAAKGVLRVPVLLHLAGGEMVDLPEIDYGGHRTRRGRLALRLALAGADQVHVPSASMLEDARRLGISARRLLLGVARDHWPPRPPRPRPEGRPARLLSVGTMNRVKDHATLLHACAALAAGGVDFTLDLVGGDILDGEVQRLAGTLGLCERVTFHGFLSQNSLRPLVERADLLVVSSRHEAGPVVALEAAAAGVPTVGTRVGLVHDWAPAAAVAVPVSDSAALADGVRSLLEDDRRRIRTAEAAQARAMAEDADWSAAELLKIYRQLVGERTGSEGGER